MSNWVERTDLRNRYSRTYQDQDNPLRRVWHGSLASLHYESVLDSGVYDTELDATPQRVDTPVLDGWRIVANDWHYALGKDLVNHGQEDGWVGFGGRHGHNWFKFRLLRTGYLHWPTRTWQDIGGPPNYNRSNLSHTTNTVAIGPNADQIAAESVATQLRPRFRPPAADDEVVRQAVRPLSAGQRVHGGGHRRRARDTA